MVSLLLVVAIVLQIPSVQTSLAKYASEKLSEEIQFDILIDKVNISWFDQVSLEQVVIYDENKQLLFSAGNVEVNYDLIAIIRD